MQEFQSIPGLAGRLFGRAGASDLRRAHAHHQQGARCGGGVSPEAVKCPRCESTNTKFCYYNNYNLSQPRHFCKSCRRYWTKGGVLRNVPVGGGCRKAKRSSSSSSAAASSAPSTPTSTEAAKNPRRASASAPRCTNSGSGSPSSPAAAATTTTAAAAAPSSSNNNIAVHTGQSSTTNPFSSTAVDVAPPAPIFADQAAALASLFAPPLPVFSFAAQQQPKDEAARPDDDMAAFTPLDAGIFEHLGDASSSSAYWSAGSCWTDDVADPSVYLP